MIKPEEFFYLLSDETRLRCLLLLKAKSKCCVCDFAFALEIIQPKISRHLAILRGFDVVSDRREGVWVYYCIHPNLPVWASHVLSTISKDIYELYSFDIVRLNTRDRSHCETSSDFKVNQDNLFQSTLSKKELSTMVDSNH